MREIGQDAQKQTPPFVQASQVYNDLRQAAQFGGVMGTGSP
jgi:hypothetical protein